MRTIGVGVIGMGWMGEAHARAYNAIGDRFHEAPFRPRLVVCADEAATRAVAARDRFGFEASTTDWRAVVDFQFLTSVVSGVQGEPGFREALAVARVQESIMRSWESERWEPVAYQE